MTDRAEAAREILDQAEVAVGRYNLALPGNSGESVRHAVLGMPHMRLYPQEVDDLLRDLRIHDGSASAQIETCAMAQEALCLGMDRLFFTDGRPRSCAWEDLKQVLHAAQARRLDELGDNVAEVTLPLYRSRGYGEGGYPAGHLLTQMVVFLVDSARVDEINAAIAAAQVEGEEVTANRIGETLPYAVGRKCFQEHYPWHESPSSGGNQFRRNNTGGLGQLAAWVLDVKDVRVPGGPRRMLTAYKGIAPVSMPERWLQGFDPSLAFAEVGGEARVRFPRHGAFGIRVEGGNGKPWCQVRRLSEDEVVATIWGGPTALWEAATTVSLFGHGPVTALDEIA